MTKNRKQCILHIGAPKTGSTALEKFLAHNRDRLSGLGWEYPDVSLRGFGHHDLAFLISGGYPEWATPQERPLDDLTSELATALKGKKKAIISSENFYLFPKPQDMAAILAQVGFPSETVNAAVYVRRQDEAHISWYNQAVKAQGYTGTIGECIKDKKSLWNYAEGLKPWAEVFGPDNLIVRPYQASDLVKRDIRYDFLYLAGLPPENLDWPEEETNTRINADILEFQRIVNRLPLSFQEKRRFHKHLIELTAATKGMGLFNDPPLLSVEQRREILAEYAESNNDVARLYLERERLFDETMPNQGDPFDREEGLNMEKLVYMFGWILARNKFYDQSGAS